MFAGRQALLGVAKDIHPKADKPRHGIARDSRQQAGKSHEGNAKNSAPPRQARPLSRCRAAWPCPTAASLRSADASSGSRGRGPCGARGRKPQAEALRRPVGPSAASVAWPRSRCRVAWPVPRAASPRSAERRLSRPRGRGPGGSHAVENRRQRCPAARSRRAQSAQLGPGRGAGWLGPCRGLQARDPPNACRPDQGGAVRAGRTRSKTAGRGAPPPDRARRSQRSLGSVAVPVAWPCRGLQARDPPNACRPGRGDAVRAARAVENRRQRCPAARSRRAQSVQLGPGRGAGGLAGAEGCKPAIRRTPAVQAEGTRSVRRTRPKTAGRGAPPPGQARRSQRSPASVEVRGVYSALTQPP
ncbi:hypothetical protein ATH84_1002305 [Paracoccus versutus]|uniref:Uncharacterized protein n=1 Tax=Paracoccus versutus TaxID=34007 RepID=A0AAQ0KP61_PARVE|nr:hypothetical protein ATH84_1002305 [Paracoccus versutus]